jgi:hypothetical protein
MAQTEPPLTPWEIKQWIRSLGATRQEQIKVLQDLIRHANTDRMSAEDRVLCKDTLERLQNDVRREQGLPPLAKVIIAPRRGRGRPMRQGPSYEECAAE